MITDDEPTDLDDARRELAGRIEQHRQNLRRGVDDLTASVQEATRSFAPMRESPELWIVGGFVVGLWLGYGGSK